MLQDAQQLNALMDRVGRDARDFAAYKGLVQVFHQLGETGAARNLCLDLFRHLPNDSELASLAESVGVKSAGGDQFFQLVAATSPEGLADRDVVLSLVEQADPTRHADLVGQIVGDYLDVHFCDEIVQAAQLRFEMRHFADLSAKCRQLHTRFSPRAFKLTCIVSTYSSAAFIKECLDDLVAQTMFEDMEVLIIDAHSPQNEAEVVKPFLERYDNIRYLVTPHRIGIYPAWTMGSLLASAPYITPLSTNDRLLPNAYETLVRALDTNPRATLVYGDSYLTDKPHQSIGTHSHSGFYRWPEIDYGWLMLTCGIGPQPMWRKSVHAKIGYFDRRYKATGDQDFFLRHAREGGLLHVPELTGMAWITKDSLSGHPSALAECLNIQVKHFKSLEAQLLASARLEIWQEFRRRYLELTTHLPLSGCAQAATDLRRRHEAYFQGPPV